MNIITSHSLLNGRGYLGHVAQVYPPLFPLLTTGLGLFFPLETGAKLLSVIGAGGLLALAPLYSYFFSQRFLPGIVVQLILGLDPSYFLYGMQADSHIFHAFLFGGSLLLGLYALNRGDFWIGGFSLVATLSALVRYVSLLLFVAYILTAFLFSTSKNLRKNTHYIFLPFICLYGPWILYNFLFRKEILSSMRWNVIGRGLADNGLLNGNWGEWFYVQYFEYEGFTDFVFQNPELMAKNILINSGRILELLFFDFTPFGILSVSIGLGILAVINRTGNRVEYNFLLTVFVLYCVVMSVAFVRWFLFLHMAVVFSTIFFTVFFEFLDRKLLTGKEPLTKRKGILLSLVLVVLLVQTGRSFADHQKNLTDKFRIPKPRPPEVQSYVENHLREVTKQTSRKRSVRVQSMTYPAQIYRAGLAPTIAPIPHKSSREVLCYARMKKDRLALVTGHNFPPAAPSSQYVPAEYFLAGPYYRSLVRRQEGTLWEELSSNLSVAENWDSKYGIKLYKVKKSLDCFPDS